MLPTPFYSEHFDSIRVREVTDYTEVMKPDWKEIDIESMEKLQADDRER